MKNDFEKGNIDRFNFTGQNLGEKNNESKFDSSGYPINIFYRRNH